MRAQGLVNAWPLSIAKHVDKVQVGRDQRLERAVGHQGFDGAAPPTKTQAPGRLMPHRCMRRTLERRMT